MSQFSPSVQALFDVLTSEVQSRLIKEHSGDAHISWTSESADHTPSELIWSSWSLSIDPACSVRVGASWAAWKEICGLDAEVTSSDFRAKSLAPLTAVVQQAARSSFGSEVTCGAAESSEEPPSVWTSLPFSIEPAPGASMLVHFSISPALEAALGGSAPATEEPEKQDLTPRLAVPRNSTDILMRVEMPVTIVLGGTKMLLKDLLKLTDGSVVELDQMLDEEVEVRINNVVIAYGEVVAVDGNYAVRILRMAPAQNTPDFRGELSEKAA